MYCKNCGNYINQEGNFCAYCGNKIEREKDDNIESSTVNEENLKVNENYMKRNNADLIEKIDQGTVALQNKLNQNLNNSNNISKSNWKNTTSIIIGVISFVLVFILQVLTMPLSIVGLVFGIKSFKESKNNKIGLVLNTISLILAIPLLLLYSSLMNLQSNPAVGIWNCKSFNNGYNDNLEYIVTMELSQNNNFIWNKYQDRKNNYVSGEYEFEDLFKTNKGETTDYYSIKLIGDKFVENGVLQSEPYNAEYEMGIIRNSNEAILMNVQSYNMYYCYRTDNQ